MNLDKIKIDKNLTDKKQIELIKLLSTQFNGLLILNPTDDKEEFLIGTHYYYGRCETIPSKLGDFQSSLSNLIVEIWDNCTINQKEKIREIINKE